MRTSTSPLLFAALICASCRTAPPDPAPVRTAAPTSLPAAASPELPGVTGRSQGDLVYDHRGAYGPLKLEQLEVSLGEGHARCLRAPHGEPQQEASLELTPAEVEALATARDALLAAPPRDVRRSAKIHDMGVVTLAARGGEDQLVLVVDGAKTLDPYPDELFRRLVELRGRCPYTAAAAASQPTTGVTPAAPTEE